MSLMFATLLPALFLAAIGCLKTIRTKLFQPVQEAGRLMGGNWPGTDGA